MVRHGDGPGRYLHHNFVVSLLNDLFGIQSRGGCSCAGPYGHRLLGIDLDRSHEFEREITRGCEGIKPGWVRVNFNYFIDDETFDYIVGAVGLVADAGRALLPWYRFEPESGLWRHRDGVVAAPLSLHDVKYDDGHMAYTRRPRSMPAGGLADHLDRARRLLDAAAADPPAAVGLPDHHRRLRIASAGSPTPTRRSQADQMSGGWCGWRSSWPPAGRP